LPAYYVQDLGQFNGVVLRFGPHPGLSLARGNLIGEEAGIGGIGLSTPDVENTVHESEPEELTLQPATHTARAAGGTEPVLEDVRRISREVVAKRRVMCID
jgi:hypothetical protein